MADAPLGPVGFCEFEFRGGPFDGKKALLGTQACDCCGKQIHPQVVTVLGAEGAYFREKPETTFHWKGGLS